MENLAKYTSPINYLGYFLIPPFHHPSWGKNNLHNGFIQPSPKRQGRIGRMIFDSVQALISCGEEGRFETSGSDRTVEREGWESFGVDWLVVEPTHLKNMLVKLGIFPKVRGEHEKSLKPQSSWGFLKVELYFHPWSFTFAEDTKMTWTFAASF